MTLPNDGAGAKLNTFKETYGHRYTEMFLIGGNAITKNLEANVYNTWGLNGSDTTGDSCPAALLDKVDVKQVKEQYGMLASFKNGPRMWTLDWIEVEMGKELDFGGMKARWVNWLDLKGISTEPGAADYKNITVTRHTHFGFNKGTRISVLDDPEGNPWVMKSFSLITFPDQKFDEISHPRQPPEASAGLEVPLIGARPGSDPHPGQGRHRAHHAGQLRQHLRPRGRRLQQHQAVVSQRITFARRPSQYLSKEPDMSKRTWIVAAVAAAIAAGIAYAQYPIMDAVANKVIQKYQNASCEQLWQQKGQPKSAEEQRVIGFLQNDPQMRQAFFNKVSGPIVNKMFTCGMIP